jgi:hypothetical protein
MNAVDLLVLTSSDQQLSSLKIYVKARAVGLPSPSARGACIWTSVAFLSDVRGDAVGDADERAAIPRQDVDGEVEGGKLRSAAHLGFGGWNLLTKQLPLFCLVTVSSYD